jgi:DNA (cytosine-5)-methyltransferase 1
MITFTDIFCGAGGSSIGLAAAGMQLQLAANHWHRAIETHSTNFPDADHLLADVSNYDMRRLPRTDLLWASPICTEMSPAGRRQRRRKQQLELELEGQGHVEEAGFERTRATFMDVIRATEVHRYAVVLVENVVDVATEWALFDWWLSGMKLLGYAVQFVSVSSAHVGSESNPYAPQWRDRLYMVFTRTGIRQPDVEPRPLAWCGECGEPVPARQVWRKQRVRKIGKYRQQYDYRCPHARCRHALVEPYVAPAAAAIDWSDLGVRIGERAARSLPALRPNTLRRIQTGLDMFTGEPPMITVNHWGDDPAELAFPTLVIPYRKGAKPHLTDQPISTVATREQHGLLRSAVAIEECRYRMLRPREQLRAQRFPDSYVVTGNVGEQTMQAGNAVSANVAQWLGGQLSAALDQQGAAT